MIRLIHDESHSEELSNNSYLVVKVFEDEIENGQIKLIVKDGQIHAYLSGKVDGLEVH